MLQLIHNDVCGPMKTESFNGSNFDLVKQFKDQMLKIFELIDLGEMSYFLGMETRQTTEGIFIR